MTTSPHIFCVSHLLAVVINTFFIIPRDHYNLVITWLHQNRARWEAKAELTPPSPHRKPFLLLTWRKEEAARWFLTEELRGRSRKVRLSSLQPSLCVCQLPGDYVWTLMTWGGGCKETGWGVAGRDRVGRRVWGIGGVGR